MILLKIISLSLRILLNPQFVEFYSTVSVHFIGVVVKKWFSLVGWSNFSALFPRPDILCILHDPFCCWNLSMMIFFNKTCSVFFIFNFFFSLGFLLYFQLSFELNFHIQNYLGILFTIWLCFLGLSLVYLCPLYVQFRVIICVCLELFEHVYDCSFGVSVLRLILNILIGDHFIGMLVYEE